MRTDKKPWFKQPYLWLIIFFPAFSVVAGLSLLFYSIQIDDGVVVDDYYKKGNAINLDLTRDRNAQDLGMAGQVTYLPEFQKMEIKLFSSNPIPLNETIKVDIMHTTIGRMDVHKNFTTTSKGNYTITIPAILAKGGWIIQIGNKQWRIHGRIHVPNNYSTSMNSVL